MISTHNVDWLFLTLDWDVRFIVVKVKMNLRFTRNLLVAWATINTTVMFLFYIFHFLICLTFLQTKM